MLEIIQEKGKEKRKKAVQRNHNMESGRDSNPTGKKQWKTVRKARVNSHTGSEYGLLLAKIINQLTLPWGLFWFSHYSAK